MWFNSSNMWLRYGGHTTMNDEPIPEKYSIPEKLCTILIITSIPIVMSIAVIFG